MKNRTLAFILFLYFPISLVFGQLKQDKHLSLTNTNEDERMIINFYPSRLINFRQTGFEVGFEIKNNSWFSTEIRGTQLFSKRLIDNNSSWNPNVKGNILHIEERFNVRNKALNGPYFAVAISQLWTNYKEEYWYNYRVKLENDVILKEHYQDTISIHKRYTDVTLKFGYQGIVNNLVLGFDVGIGARYKDVRHKDLIHETAYIDAPSGINFNYTNDQVGFRWVFVVPISFRIGLVL